MKTKTTKPIAALKGTRIVSLALNLPGPAALMRCRAMGAQCVKVEPPPASGGDPMQQYNPAAYAQLHQGVRVVRADLKTEKGQRQLAKELAKAQVVLTSFRPSALQRLGLDWDSLRKRYPKLSLVCIVGGEGADAEVPGHDLTYLADNGLVTGLDLPATLYADMAGSLQAVEAVFSVLLQSTKTGKGQVQTVALNRAAQYMSLPRVWGLTTPDGSVGGAHAGYRVYPCKGGRVAVAALEPHFAHGLCQLAGMQPPTDPAEMTAVMLQAQTQTLLRRWFAQQTPAVLTQLAQAHDVPMVCLS